MRVIAGNRELLLTCTVYTYVRTVHIQYVLYRCTIVIHVMHMYERTLCFPFHLNRDLSRSVMSAMDMGWW